MQGMALSLPSQQFFLPFCIPVIDDKGRVCTCGYSTVVQYRIPAKRLLPLSSIDIVSTLNEISRPVPLSTIHCVSMNRIPNYVDSLLHLKYHQNSYLPSFRTGLSEMHSWVNLDTSPPL